MHPADPRYVGPKSETFVAARPWQGLELWGEFDWEAEHWTWGMEPWVLLAYVQRPLVSNGPWLLPGAQLLSLSLRAPALAYDFRQGVAKQGITATVLPIAAVAVSYQVNAQAITSAVKAAAVDSSCVHPAGLQAVATHQPAATVSYSATITPGAQALAGAVQPAPVISSCAVQTGSQALALAQAPAAQAFDFLQATNGQAVASNQPAAAISFTCLVEATAQAIAASLRAVVVNYDFAQPANPQAIAASLNPAQVESSCAHQAAVQAAAAAVKAVALAFDYQTAANAQSLVTSQPVADLAYSAALLPGVQELRAQVAAPALAWDCAIEAGAQALACALNAATLDSSCSHTAGPQAVAAGQPVAALAYSGAVECTAQIISLAITLASVTFSCIQAAPAQSLSLAQAPAGLGISCTVTPAALALQAAPAPAEVGISLDLEASTGSLAMASYAPELAYDLGLGVLAQAMALAHAPPLVAISCEAAQAAPLVLSWQTQTVYPAHEACMYGTFQEWSSIYSTEKVYSAEFNAVKKSDGALLPLRFATTGGVFDTIHFFEPCIAGLPNVSQRAQQLEGGQSLTTYGRLILAMERGRTVDGAGQVTWDKLIGEYDFVGQEVTIKVGNQDLSHASWGVVLRGFLGQASYDDQTLEIPLSDLTEKVCTQKVPPREYGEEEVLRESAGKAKPLCFGRCLNITPVLIDKDTFTYQWHDPDHSPSQAVDAVYVKGLPTAGYSVDLINSTIRFGADPQGRVTLDVRGAAPGGVYLDRVGPIVRELLTAFGGVDASQIDGAAFAQYDLDVPFPVGIYLNRSMELRRAIDSLCTGLLTVWGASKEGVFYILRFAPAAGEAKLAVDDVDLLSFRAQSVEQLYWEAVIKGDRNWTPDSSPDDTVAAERREWLQDDFRSRSVSDAAVQARYPTASTTERETHLADLDDCATVATWWLACFGSPTRELTGETALRALILEPGDVCQVSRNRFGMEQGVLGRMVGIEANHTQGTLRLEMWV
ncbi:MAG: hypothetical protein V1797_09655 [Pseudomonadota bacterium]